MHKGGRSQEIQPNGGKDMKIKKLIATALTVSMAMVAVVVPSITAKATDSAYSYEAYDDVNYDSDGNLVSITRYTDGKTYNTAAEAAAAQEADAYTIPQKIVLSNSGRKFFKIQLRNGDCTIKNKSVVDNKIASVYVDKNKTSRTVYTNDTENKSCATYVFKINPKKVGKTYLTFDIYNSAGKKTASKKIKLIVQEDGTPFKSVTFAGKSLMTKSYSSNSDYIYAGNKTYNNENSGLYTTKDSGKFKVTMNKTYKLVKILVGTRTAESSTEDGVTTVKTDGRKVDLNMDGDTNDIVMGQSESQVTYTYKVKKNNNKVVLSTVPKQTTTTYSSADVTYSKNSISSTADTKFLVVYYNKATKKYGVQSFYIYKKV